jgi:hypothetical protein
MNKIELAVSATKKLVWLFQVHLDDMNNEWIEQPWFSQNSFRYDDLRVLTKRIREETKGSTEWYW